MAKENKDWFAVDKRGLAQLLERRGKSFAVLELVSNAWDQDTTTVDVSLQPTGQRARYELVVTDDDPNGFLDLAHAYTLFAPSNKKGEAEKRGRFNLGEKLVLALCETATITSTKGTVTFDGTGRKQTSAKRPVGSEFRAVVHLTKPEFEETCEVIRTLIPPPHVETVFNGEILANRDPVRDFKAQLATEIADEEGNLRPSTRNTIVRIYEPLSGETPTIYEMGIPVVENNDRWHYDIGQKVPLNMDRDNVKPAYLRHLRTLVANEMYNHISTEDANSTWVKEALSDERILPEAVTAIVEKRFGEKVVIFDPSDPEANNRAVSEGYSVVHGRSLSKPEWANVKRTGAILPAGQVTPSDTKLFQEQLQQQGESGEIEIERDKWTPGMVRLSQYAKALGSELLGFEPEVGFVSEVTLAAAAFYGGRKVTFNVGRLSHRWFNEPNQVAVDSLLIHEFAHQTASNHLDHSFHDECCRLGAVLRNVNITIDAFDAPVPS